jgi:phospholipid/cholesterol/gamma-HCH transport system substrate-binding protein
MNMERWGETLLGAAVAGVAIFFFVFAAAQAGQTNTAGAYEVSARFDRVDGIAPGSDVRVSGVKVGVVRSVALDPATFQARLVFALDRDVRVPGDSTARIATDGLLGGAYVSIEPAGLDPLADGGEIMNTQGSIDLLTLFASFASGSNETETEEANP